MSKIIQSIDSFFRISKRGSNFKIELLGGLTTFLTMAYILFSNPSIMAAVIPADNGGTIQLIPGLNVQALFLITALAAAGTTLFMGLFAKLPVALAPGMGLNAFFSFTVVLSMGLSWQQALGVVFVSGVLYFIISITGIRKKVVNAIPQSLKYAIGAGIGFFIAFIGLKNAQVIVADQVTFVKLGDLGNPVTLLALFGIALMFVLIALKVKAAVFYGLVGTAVVGLIAGLFGVSDMPVYTSLVSADLTFGGMFGAAFSELGSVLTTAAGWTAIFAFLFVDFFDTAGTLMAVTSNMEGVEEKDIDRANIVDAVGTIGGSILGTSTTTSYIESLSGVGVGARTGLASVVTGLLFILFIFFSPLLSLVTPSVTAAAMVVVGTMMASSLGKVDWKDPAISTSAFITILAMILTYSISEGIGLGFITYVLITVFSGKWRKVSPILYVVAVLFLVHYILL